MKEGVRDIGWAILPCNWLQIMENSLDPVHVEWLHRYFTNYVLERLGRQRPDEPHYWRSAGQRPAAQEDRLRRLRARHREAPRARGRRREQRPTGASATRWCFPNMLQLRTRSACRSTTPTRCTGGTTSTRSGTASPSSGPKISRSTRSRCPGVDAEGLPVWDAGGQQLRPGQLRLELAGPDHPALDRAPGRVRQGHHPLPAPAARADEDRRAGRRPDEHVPRSRHQRL